MSTRECADLLIEARWLLPIAPANTTLADHAVAVCAGRIVAMGPAAQRPALALADRNPGSGGAALPERGLRA
jgi:hypothetical protein